jgi:hypothetical protein
VAHFLHQVDSITEYLQVMDLSLYLMAHSPPMFFASQAAAAVVDFSTHQAAALVDYFITHQQL